MTDTTTSSHTASALVELPARTVLAVDGEGPPESPAFARAVEALYAALGADAPIEGHWWSGDDPFAFDFGDPDGWRWTLSVPAPDADGDHSRPAPPAVRLERRPPERVVALVHHGSYAEEGPSLAALYAFADDHGLAPAGAHSEVYLTDPQQVAPADLRTELRLPVR